MTLYAARVFDDGRLGQAIVRPDSHVRNQPRWVARSLAPTYRFQRASTPIAFRPDGKLPEPDDDQLMAGPRIRCPACQWQPDRKSRWFCLSMGPPENFNSGCGHGWNTFDTGGICPGCLYQWQHTTCLSCGVTSLHDDWYEASGAGP